MKKVNILKVAGKSNVSAVAGSIVKSIEDGRDVELHAIGASAVNQTVKAIATARGILSAKGKEALVRVGFGETEIEGELKTMMIFRIVLV
ncbi:MAG: stage V sporulation protein S [Thermosipho sp. (in: Bacteria)]|nr:stage V sporulation protein S [Thermosipho sp. (in: thermotogales)]